MKILLVDDDPAVLRVLLGILKCNPAYETTIGTGAALALENAESMGGVDLLVTDVVMDPVDGFTLNQQMRAKYPAIQTIFISGYDLSDYAAHTAGCAVLMKPVDATLLLETVAAIEPLVPAVPPQPARSRSGMIRPIAVPTAVAVATPTATPVARPAGPTAVAVASARPVAVATPVATPVARPATPTAVAAPTATPRPVATPVARPAAPTAVAAPTATPVATPRPIATPVARPATPTAVAAPTATPVAVPTPVATPVARPAAPTAVAAPTAAPVAVPAPVATPVARPAAPTAVAAPTAAPVAVPAPVATSVARPAAPTAVAAPTAAPVAVPTPVAAPVARPAAAPVSPLEDEEVFASDDLLNKKIGNYNIVWKIGQSEWGPIYVAVQTSMARPVAMKILSEEVQAGDPTAKQRFLNIARAQAAVKHPSILAVYEGGEASGHTYYTYEYVDGVQLEEMKAQGQFIDDPVALKIVKAVAEGLSYLHHHKISHTPLEPQRIYIGKDGRPHLANIASLPGEALPDVEKDIATLSRIIGSLLVNGSATDPGLRGMLMKMAVGGPAGFLSWGALLQAVKALEPKVIPADAVKLTAQEQAAIRAVEETKRQQKRTLLMTSAGIFVLLWVALFIVYWNFFRSNERSHDEMVAIPAGAFLFGDENKRVTTGAFWIDKYEVTIGQYARFLDAVESEDDPTKFDHPKQPKGKTHVPCADRMTWDTYYGRARIAKPAKGAFIDLNCPVFEIDWWDAYAYAKWAGKRLPTEEEWEKAGRGTNAFKFPWGNEPDNKRANTGNDYGEDPRAGTDGQIDGYTWWAPVDAFAGDKSPFGVIGMAGNVAEWVDTWDAAKKHPVIRGGSFHTKDVKITRRFTEAEPETRLIFIGFRCVSDKAPKK